MFKNILENYFQKLRIKKQTQKTITKQITKEKKHCESIIGIFLKIKKKWKKEHANIRSKNMSDEDKEGKKEYMGNY